MPDDPFYAGGGIGLGPRPETEEFEPYPDPLVTSAEGVPGPVKQAVDTMARMARAQGWTVVVTYAYGYTPHGATGRPAAKPTESLAVRMARKRDRAVAVYRAGSSWTWDTLYIWNADDRTKVPTKYDSVSDFQVARGMALKASGTAAWNPPWIRSW